jgi:hypothetical protein
MSIQLANLQAEVSAEHDAEVAALILQEGLLGQMDAAGTDLSKLTAFKEEWRAAVAANAEAVVANTARKFAAAEKTPEATHVPVGAR